MLINPCRYLDSLQYHVWKKMISSIKSVPFSFYPNTAAGWLSVSDDLTSVTNHGYCLQVENQSFSSAPCLLGSCTFSQGSHAWEVALGDLQSWRMGVVRVQPDTGAEGHSHSCYHDTRSGFWYVCRTQGVEGDHCVTSDPATSPLVLTILRRLCVELECEEGFKKEDNFVPWPVPPAPFNSNQSVGRQLLWGGKQLCSTLHHDDPLHHMPRDNEASQPWMEPFETMSQSKPFILLSYLRYFVTAMKS